MKPMSSKGEMHPIRSELDIARQLITRWDVGHIGDWYVGVSLIARDLKVSPDIDLLRVYTNQYRPEDSTAIGIELKMLKPRKFGENTWRIPMSPFYQGIGQVLTYFEHGIDRAALVIGFHEECDRHPTESKQAERLLRTHCSAMKSSILAALPYLLIYSMKGGSLESLVSSPNWDRVRFPIQDQETKLRRDSILRLQFAPKTLGAAALSPKANI